MLSSAQINLIESTWAEVAPLADPVAVMFYDKLFQIDSNLRRVFPADMAEQRRKLMQALVFTVACLRTPERLVPILHEMGRRHSGYGVLDEHFDTVGEALIWTLRAGLGEAFTPEAEEAWALAYELVSDTMRASMAEEVA